MNKLKGFTYSYAELNWLDIRLQVCPDCIEYINMNDSKTGFYSYYCWNEYISLAAFCQYDFETDDIIAAAFRSVERPEGQDGEDAAESLYEDLLDELASLYHMPTEGRPFSEYCPKYFDEFYDEYVGYESAASNGQKRHDRIAAVLYAALKGFYFV